MKKIVVLILTFGLLFSFAGCSDRTLTYKANLGYDLSEVEYESIEFNVYHSKTENHKWEHLKTFSYSPEKNHFFDIKLEGTKNNITMTSVDNHLEKTENTESYRSEDIESYEFTVDGFDGVIDSFRTFEVKDIDEEQFYRLYPIDNDNGEGTFFYISLNINGSYDVEEENLDNILITIKIK